MHYELPTDDVKLRLVPYHYKGNALRDLAYDRDTILQALDERYPNSKTDKGDVSRQEGILFTKCGKG